MLHALIFSAYLRTFSCLADQLDGPFLPCRSIPLSVKWDGYNSLPVCHDTWVLSSARQLEAVTRDAVLMEALLGSVRHSL